MLFCDLAVRGYAFRLFIVTLFRGEKQKLWRIDAGGAQQKAFDRKPLETFGEQANDLFCDM